MSQNQKYEKLYSVKFLHYPNSSGNVETTYFDCDLSALSDLSELCTYMHSRGDLVVVRESDLEYLRLLGSNFLEITYLGRLVTLRKES